MDKAQMKGHALVLELLEVRFTRAYLSPISPLLLFSSRNELGSVGTVEIGTNLPLGEPEATEEAQGSRTRTIDDSVYSIPHSRFERFEYDMILGAWVRVFIVAGGGGQFDVVAQEGVPAAGRFRSDRFGLSTL